MKLFDAHTHLNGDELYPQWQKHLVRFVEAGGVGLINSGANEQYNLRGIEITKNVEMLKRGNVEMFYGKDESIKQLNNESLKHLIVKATIGYHPGECGTVDPSVNHADIITEENIQSKIDGLRSLYEANKEYIVAIGECGIDTFFLGSEDHLPLQKKLFILQCNLARELHLPLVVHVRKDFESAFAILKNYTDLTIHFHCRGFGTEEIKRLKDLKIKRLFIGFCGNVTYKNAHNLRDGLAQVPLDQLVLETDAPWLSPQAVRGTTNTPANVQYIYEFVAEYLKIPYDSLCQQVKINFYSLYMNI